MTRSVTAFLTLILSLCMAFSAWGADYPKRTITVINAWLPGGIIELGFRPVMDEMSRILGVNMVLSPNAGASGVIGTNKALASRPDGYTLLLTTDSSLVTLSRLRKVRFGTEDFQPVGTYGMSPISFCIRKGDDRFGNLDEFVAYAKAHPGELSVGLSGMQGTNHVAAAMAMHEMGLNLKLVPFDGALQVVSAVGSRHVDCAVTEILYNENVQPVAFFARERNPDYPDVPTFSEKGYPDIIWGSNFALFARAGTPPEAMDKLTAAMTQAVATPAARENLKKLYITTTFFPGPELQQMIAERSVLLQGLIDKGVMIPER